MDSAKKDLEAGVEAPLPQPGLGEADGIDAQLLPYCFRRKRTKSQ